MNSAPCRLRQRRSRQRPCDDRGSRNLFVRFSNNAPRYLVHSVGFVVRYNNIDMIGCHHDPKPRRSSLIRSPSSSPLRRRSPRAAKGSPGSVWARASRPSREALERSASAMAAQSASREASLLAAIDRLRSKLEPVAASQLGLEWDDVQPILMRFEMRTLEAAIENPNPESLLLLISQRMQSHRRHLRLDDAISEGGEIKSKRPPASEPNAPEIPMQYASLEATPTKTWINKVTGALQVLYIGFNSLLVQFALYVVYVLFFQALIASVRTKEEVYLSKYLVDNIIEEPISGDYDNDQFMSIANLGDIDLFVSSVLLPALVVDTRMDETFKTPFEMAETFDNLDWSSGLMIKQVRVAEHSQGTCGAVESGATMRWFAESQVRAYRTIVQTTLSLEACPTFTLILTVTLQYGTCSLANPLWGSERASSDAHQLDACAISQQHSYGPCLPEISNAGVNAGDLIDRKDYCYNWTDPDQPCRNMWHHFTAAELGSDPSGQPSASTEATYNTLPNDGFVAIIIPFFSETYLPDEEGSTPEEVTDYRQHAFDVSRGTSPPNFFCVRLSWNGVAVEQLCDPNDSQTGRMTGRVLSRPIAHSLQSCRKHLRATL